MPEREKRPLTVVSAPSIGRAISAPPILDASTHTIDYTCGKCGTVLMHAEADQIHGLLIHCSICGTYNATDP
jgi:hypothetical protein